MCRLERSQGGSARAEAKRPLRVLIGGVRHHVRTGFGRSNDGSFGEVCSCPDRDVVPLQNRSEARSSWSVCFEACRLKLPQPTHVNVEKRGSIFSHVTASLLGVWGYCPQRESPSLVRAFLQNMDVSMFCPCFMKIL